MKKMFVLLLVALFSSQMIFSQDVIIGTVRTDGFQKITKGAFWNKRPESKMIYNGSYPPGFKVYTLESDYFVRFVDEEHNENDKNYIVFPKGEKVYTNQNGQYFAAICGNKIEFLRPVDMVSIVEKENLSPVAVKSSSPIPTTTSNPVSAQYAKKDTVYVEVERQELSDRSNQSERYEGQRETSGNNYYINNAMPYGYYGINYYGYYDRYYHSNYYGYYGPAYYFTGGNNCNGYTGGYNQYTGNTYQYTGGNNRTGRNNQNTGSSYYFTGGDNRSTGRGNSTTGQGHMTTGNGGSSNQGGGRSNVSQPYNSGNQTGRSNVSFSPNVSSFRSSGSTNGGGRR